MKKSLFLFAALLLVLASCSKLERNEKKYLDGMQSDNIEEAATAFNEFCEWVKSDKSTMTYDFSRMREELGMRILDTSDGRLRFYSWETGRGDITRTYANIVQWLTPEDHLVGYSGALDLMLTGHKANIAKQKSLAHSIDTIYELKVANQPVYVVVQSYINEDGKGMSYASAVINERMRLTALPFFFNGIENAGNREYNDNGNIKKADLIKWDAKAGKLYSYLTDDSCNIIPGKYEVYVMGDNQLVKQEEAQQ